eukprot:CAMPEP_0117577558 /NCGR_PEP_ID=MMETSP0784-20121206/63486_1 /TAXON_ID=39447 /ORGANISM="" /LENGTH=31 /DNA_ID= /DNA_START= /DNA_END= /DNA_ORIENTATION=
MASLAASSASCVQIDEREAQDIRSIFALVPR